MDEARLLEDLKVMRKQVGRDLGQLAQFLRAAISEHQRVDNHKPMAVGECVMHASTRVQVHASSRHLKMY